MLHQQGAEPAVEVGLQPVQPLPHRSGRRQRLPLAIIAAAPAHQQVAAGREQGLQQCIAILVGGLGIAKPPLLLHQVEAGPVAVAGEAAGIQAHQHDHPVGNRPHRFEGADREGATAVAKAAAFGPQAFLQHGGHHRRLQRQGGGAGILLPAVEGGQQAR